VDRGASTRASYDAWRRRIAPGVRECASLLAQLQEEGPYA
jgi:hypothetical protein